MEDFHVGPYMTAVGAGEMLTEVRLALRPGAGSAHEKVERRAGDWAIAAASAAVWIDDGGMVADAGIALSAVGLTTVHLTRAEELLRGQAPSEELFAEAGAMASEDCSPERGRPRAGRLQAPPRRRSHPTGAAPRDGARPASGGLIINVSMTVNGERVSHDVEPRLLLVHFIRETLGPHGHPLGLRHLELRRLRRADRRRAGQVVHDPGGDVRGARRPHGRVARGRRPRSTRSSRASTSCTRSSAGSARRGC